MSTHDVPAQNSDWSVPLAEPLSDIAQPALAISELLNELNAVTIKLRHRGKLENGGPAISVAEHAVLEIINRQGAATVPEIARGRFTSRQNTQILVDRLESEGHVEIVGNPEHKRSALVRLTEQGRTWLQEDKQNRKKFHNEIGCLFSSEEISLLRSALRRLHTALGMENGLAQNGNACEISNVRSHERLKPAAPSKIAQPELTEDQLPVSLL